MRPKTKFLTVVWGETYIARFASLALPSFLAQGNLPALANATELEVVIMTRHDDMMMFEDHAAFRSLRQICPVRFVEIDDLITSAMYGVTLTLAYARPIIACGSEMVNIHFVFMNADFVLADGSLLSLSNHILAGRSIVLGPSFRSTAEAVEPILEAAVDKTSGILAIPPRALTALSMAHPHPTTIAKIVNQDFCHSTQANQFFWQVDSRTILGRYYLIFMLALKPEKIISTINSYCDYALVPELCPSGDEVVMGDSDDFFMLELQQRDQELGLLRLGRQNEAELARSLSYWTTAEHRRAAAHDVIFHSGEFPHGLNAVKTEARAFVARVERQLGLPQHHARHRYWTSGVRAWIGSRKAQGLSDLPAELPLQNREFFHWAQYILHFWHGIRYISRMIPLHPYWLDYEALKKVISKTLAANNARILVVRDNAFLAGHLIEETAAITFVDLQELLTTGPPVPDHVSGVYTHVAIFLLSKDGDIALAAVRRCRGVMSSTSTCTLFVHRVRGALWHARLESQLDACLEGIVGDNAEGNVTKVNSIYIGGSLFRFNSKLYVYLARQYRRFGLPSFFWILPIVAIGFPLAAVINLFLAIRKPQRHFMVWCSNAAANSRNDA